MSEPVEAARTLGAYRWRISSLLRRGAPRARRRQPRARRRSGAAGDLDGADVPFRQRRLKAWRLLGCRARQVLLSFVGIEGATLRDARRAARNGLREASNSLGGFEPFPGAWESVARAGEWVAERGEPFPSGSG